MVLLVTSMYGPQHGKMRSHASLLLSHETIFEYTHASDVGVYVLYLRSI